MADDQVKYSDLIAQDVQPGLTMLAEALKTVAEQIASLKTEATALKGAMSAAGTATREQQQATAQQAASVEGLSKKVKQLTEEERRLEEVRKRYKKLTDEQIERVNAFQQALRGSTQQQMAAVNAIDVETKSYNELNAMYNALKDSLNAMTIAERQNTEAGKAMTMQSAKIYDTMNELQKATGKYTLQVGKYRAAFDGLGYSFQQILREAPSALNLNQFFLAISNNIPMFLDQLKAFKNEQAEIKANLANMTEGTAAYAEQLGKVETVGKKLGKVLVSWQSLVLVGLMILRNMDKIVNWIKSLGSSVRNMITDTIKMRSLINTLSKEAEKAVSDQRMELNLIVESMRNVTTASDEWRKGIERINEITNQNLNATHATIKEVEAVTDAYIEQMRVIEYNKKIIGALIEDDFNKDMMNMLKSGKITAKDAAKSLGLGAEKAEELTQLENEYRAARRTMEQRRRDAEKEANNPKFKEARERGNRLFIDRMKSAETLYKDAQNAVFDAQERYFSLINASIETLDEKSRAELRKKYKNVGKTGTSGSGGSTKEMKDQVADLLTLQRQLEDAIISNIEDEYKREEAAEIARHQRFIEDKQKELELVKGDAKRTAVINQQIEEEQETHSRNMLEIDEKRRQELIKQSDEEEKLREKNAKESAQRTLKAMADGWQEERAQLVAQGKSRKELIDAELEAEIARLETMLELNRTVNGEIMSDEEKAKVKEWIKLLDQIWAKGDFSNIKPGQIFGKGAANITSDKKNYTSVMDILFPGWDSDKKSALNSVFDQAKEALNSWMDARKAAADQAKELADDEVSAAENALNREIELRNQGYANDVALREKELADAKAAQKKAAEEQKKVAQEQVLLDAALQTSSMITASANIIKQFPNPLAWAPMLALMWGTFAYAKTKAYQASTKSIKFKEGGVMLLEGGSHESGHDVNLGIGPDGSNLRAEGGEYFAVINKRSSRKYGSQIPSVVNALNSGMFEDRYIKTSDAVGLLPQVIRADNGTAVDLSSLEGGVDALVKQGESRWSTEGEWRVMRYKNLTRRVRIS